MKKTENKTKKISTILILAILMLFAGCSGDDNGTKTSGFGSIGGSTSSNSGSGVELSFAEGNPSTEMYKGNPTTFAFIFTNYQEHDITDMQVKAKGFEEQYVTGITKSVENIGTIPRLTTQSGAGIFPGYILSGVTVDNFEETYNFNPTFDYCYSAMTLFREQVCVPSTKNTCDTTITKSQAQNGPLSVSIDRIVNSDANTVRVDFTITNKGKGQVLSTCFETEEYANTFTQKVTLGSQSPKGECTAVSGFNIINKKANFYCEFARSGDDSYASQIVVELNYKYQQSEKKSITVKDLNAGYSN